MYEFGNGFVIVPRELMQNQWYTHSPTIHLYLHCLLRANYTDSEWHGITIQRGQFVTSLNTLSQETGLSIKQIRSALDRLKKAGYVASKQTNKYRIITMLNYDEMQQTASKMASKGQTKGKQRATDKENNKGTNIIVGQNPTAYSNEIKTIVDHLNSKLGTHFKTSSIDTRKHITARLREGYTLEDFKTVIDSKTKEWRGTDNQKYLRPETLFGKKFEGYLNAAHVAPQDEIQKLLEGYNR